MNQHKQKTISGLKWSGINQAIKQTANITIGILLARLLQPSDFGLLGMVTVITGFIQLFNDFGFGAALIQKQDATEADYHSVFWFNLATGFTLFLILFLTSPFIGSFYTKPEVIPLVKAVSWIFIIQALSYVQYTLLKKELNFKAIFIIESVTMMCSGIIALFMAYNGFGVYSLVAQLLTAACINLVLLWFMSTWRPTFQFSTVSIKRLLTYSMPLMGSTALNYTLGNLDKLLIGRYLGAINLGIYTRAYSLMVFPVGQISGVISQVMFPSLAQIQDDKPRIRAIYLKMNTLISAITFPIMGAAFVFAEPFVLHVLGEQWRQMIPVFKILTLVGAIQSVATLVGNIFMALGAMKLYFKVNVFSGIIFIMGSVIGLQFGLMGVVIAFAIATLMVSIPQWFLTGKLIQLDLINYFKAFFSNAIATIVCVLIFTNLLTFFNNNNPYIILTFGGFCFLLTYLLLMRVFNPTVINQFLQIGLKNDRP